MERIRLTDRAHYLRAGVNSGLVETATGLLLIDSGLDRSAANRIVRAAEELGRPIVAVLNTHAHADHHGGNAQLVRKLGIPVWAPAVEEAVIREPRYEPIYLYGGGAPTRALENRFLQAEPSPVDRVVRPGERLVIDGAEVEIIDLAGHSIAQVGVRSGGVLYAADSFFGEEPLAKHGIPFLVDAGRTRESLRALETLEAEWYVPGHGEALRDPSAAVAANLRVIEEVWGWLGVRLRRGGPAATEELLADLAAAFELTIADPTGFVLYRATLLGYLSAMERVGDARVVVEAGRWRWEAG